MIHNYISEIRMHIFSQLRINLRFNELLGKFLVLSDDAARLATSWHLTSSGMCGAWLISAGVLMVAISESMWLVDG